MRSLWFVVPVHGRLQLARICLRQLRRTCDALREHDIDASAVLVSDRRTLVALREFEFAEVVRDNSFLGAKFNDGIQLATDPQFNARPVDFVVPCGSDDWIDFRLLVELPPDDTMYGFERLSFVRHDGRELLTTRIDYLGGCGLRIYPRALMQRVGYRPCEEDRRRGCDTSMLLHVRAANANMRVVHRHNDARQIVDFKTIGQNVTPYETIFARHRGDRHDEPFALLSEFHPREAIEEMRQLYAGRLIAA